MPCLIDPLLKSALKVNADVTPKPFNVSDFAWIPSIPFGARESHQDDVLYRMGGYIIHSMQNRNMLKCSGCITQLSHRGEFSHPNSLLQRLMDFKEGAQFSISDELFQVLRLVEHNLLVWIPKLQETQVNMEDPIDLIIKPKLAHVTFQTCHDVKDKILKAFTLMRYKQIAARKLSPLDGNSTASLASKTAGAQYLTKRYNPSAKNAATQQRSPKVERLANASDTKSLAAKKLPTVKRLLKLP